MVKKNQNKTQGVANAVSFITISATKTDNLIFHSVLSKQKQFLHTVHKYVLINLSMIMGLIL